MKRVILRSLGVLLAVIVVLLLVFTFSPWPAVAVVRYAFSKGDEATDTALAKHVPAGIVSRTDLAYGQGKDEVFDLAYPQGAGALPTIVWVHGGGFIAGSKREVANYVKVLAGSGYTAIAIEYSRGGDANYPKPLEQVNEALGFVSSHAAELHVNPASIILGGDSAGAHIASQVALIVTNPAYAKAIGIAPKLGREQLVATLLVSGIFDPFTVDRQGPRAFFSERMMWAYSGVKSLGVDERFRLMSVPAHVTRAFPPTYLTSGNGDSLAPQAVVLADRLKQLGVRTDVLFFPADHSPPLPHEYQFNLDRPEGREAQKRMLEFLRTVEGASLRT